MTAEAVDLVATVRPWLEIAYFAAGILVPIAALLAVWQIRVAKAQLETTKELFKTQSKRNAFELAVNECRNFSDRLTPLVFELDKYIEESKLTIFEKAEITKSEDGIKVTLKDLDSAELEKLKAVKKQITEILNTLEAFALFFTTGVADENIGFHTVGGWFVHEAERAAKLLTVLNATQDDSKAIWVLYFRWEKRLEHFRLSKEKKNIEKRLRETSVPEVKAIGT